MKKFIIIYLERRENVLNFIQYFNKYRVWSATLFRFLILAHCVFEFDTPDLDDPSRSRAYVVVELFDGNMKLFSLRTGSAELLDKRDVE